MAEHIADGGVWGQPFSYQDIAHLIVPRRFYWESFSSPTFQSGHKEQALDALSRRLRERRIPHQLSDLLLEVKLF